MSALSIRNMNWVVGQREIESSPRLDIFEELTESMKSANEHKHSEMTWARAEGWKRHCQSCQMAMHFHRQEKDIFEQMNVLASITSIAQ